MEIRGLLGEPGPETHFFLQALHKLARTLGGLEKIGRASFNITYVTR